MPDFSAAIALLRKPIEDLYVSSSGVMQTKVAVIRTAAKMKALHKNLWGSQRVKTIWHTDRPLSLSSFFYPVSVTSGENEATRLTSLDDLPNNHNIIFGTVGQGKSILVRYLLGKEIKTGTRIPILCELRNVENQTLIDHLCERFSILLGIKPDIDLLAAFAIKGKVSFLLDGFDEVDPVNVQKIMAEIEDLSYSYPLCRILLSSRPDTVCKSLSSFYSCKICPLQKDDLPVFYKRITNDNDFTARLVAAVETSPLKIRDLVKTPLLATLLAISYRAAHKIPLDFAEFYDDLFQILLVRHDGSKLGWQRQRKTKLNDREIQQIFEAFCFGSRKRQSSALDREIANQLATESIKECQFNSDGQNFLNDIKTITCLLVEEGKKVNFVHASVQEFFAARYIKTRTQAKAERFYNQLLTGKWAHWKEEIQFLRQIDMHRATKFFIIPDIDATIIDFLKPPGTLTTATIEHYLTMLTVRRIAQKQDGVEKIKFLLKNNRQVNTYHYAILDSIIYSMLFVTTHSGEKNWASGFEKGQTSTSRTYLEIATDKGGACRLNVSRKIKIYFEELIKERVKLITHINTDEHPTSFMDL